MKTYDGYVIKTADLYPVAGKDPDDYDYPLYAEFSTPKTYTVEISTPNIYTVEMDP